MDLVVSDSQGRIESVYVTSNKFLWSWVEVEVNTAFQAVPEPGTMGLFALGVLGMYRLRRKSRV